MNNLRLKTKSNEVQDGGIVTVAVAAFGNTDSQNDISERGSFKKTLKENSKRFKHFLNHNPDFLIGCPLDAWEDNRHLVFKSELNLETELGRDVYSNYKLYQKNGLTLEHSIGVEDIKRDPFDRRKVLEWQLWEFSTLYSWGANDQTPLLDLKALDFASTPDRAIHFLHDALRLKFSDKKLEQYEGYLHLIEKAVNGAARLVACDCGLKFDYDSVPEESFGDAVLEMAREMVRWRTQRAVEEEVAKMDPDIREQVGELLSKGRDINLFSSFVRCPRCGKRLYRSDIIPTDDNTIVSGVQKQAEPPYTGTPADGWSRREGTLSLREIGALING